MILSHSGFGGAGFVDFVGPSFDLHKPFAIRNKKKTIEKITGILPRVQYLL